MLKQETDSIISNKSDTINELENKIQKLKIDYTTIENELNQKVSDLTLKYDQTNYDFNN